VAGYAGGRLFSRGAIAACTTSGGIPRLVNIMANKALMLCYGEGKQQVTRRHVNLAASDTVTPRQRPALGVDGGGREFADRRMRTDLGVDQMSLINKMLQDLDARGGGGASAVSSRR
jgi:hypothetical protein